MKRIKYIFSLLLLGGMSLLSCRKDPQVISTNNNNNTENPYKPTSFSLSIPRRFPNPLIPSDNPLTVEGVKLGKMLFYDSILSKNYNQNCGSCHKQQYAFTDGNKNGNKRFSLGTDGVTLGNRNAPALFNKAWDPTGSSPTGGFFWDGRASTLEVQALMPIQNPKEMNMDINEVIRRLQASPMYPALFQKAFGSSTISQTNLAKAIASFVRTITSGNSEFDSVSNRQLPDFRTDDEKLGFTLFFNDPTRFNLDTTARIPMKTYRDAPNGLDCGHCHSAPLLQPQPGLAMFLNDGLPNIGDSVFKTPSLRNVALTAPYMHDGRFANLDSVLANYDHGHDAINSPYLSDFMFYKRYGKKVKMNLQPNEIRAVKAFLNSLTDYSLVSNPAYRNPFLK